MEHGYGIAFEMAGVELPPLPHGGVVLAAEFTAEMQAVPVAAFGVLNVDLDLG